MNGSNQTDIFSESIKALDYYLQFSEDYVSEKKMMMKLGAYYNQVKHFLVRSDTIKITIHQGEECWNEVSKGKAFEMLKSMGSLSILAAQSTNLWISLCW